MELHSTYESAKPFAFTIQAPDKKVKAEKGEPSLPKLKIKEGPRRIVLNSGTVLGGIPPEAWEYEISSRSAIEWILLHYRKLIAGYGEIAGGAEFDYSEHREQIIDLLGKVVTVSIRTQDIVSEMHKTLVTAK